MAHLTVALTKGTMALAKRAYGYYQFAIIAGGEKPLAPIIYLHMELEGFFVKGGRIQK
jgi:hypothetical protein